MSVIFGIILAILVFFIVVLVHEFGHFITARMTGMKVHEFGLGIPPRMKKLFTDKHGTEFTWNWLPIGGFVRISGEDARSPDAFKKDSFMGKSLPKRLLVLVAGVTMNFILAWIIFFGIFFTGARPLSVLPITAEPTHSYFLPSMQEGIESGFVSHNGIVLHPLTGSVAEASGILPGDRALRIGDQDIITVDGLITTIQTESSFELTLASETGEIKTLTIVPENGKIGSQIGYSDLRMNTGATLQAFGLKDASIMAAKETYYSSMLTFNLLGKTLGALLFPKTPEEQQEAKEMLSGPIGVGGAFVSMVDLQVPVVIILLFVALLSINLGVLNILPFPALDGGRMVTTLVYSLLSWSERAKRYVIAFE